MIYSEKVIDQMEIQIAEQLLEIDELKDRIAGLEKDLALKTRDRDVFRDFTLAYEKRIEELEKLEQDFIRVIKQTNPNKPQTKPAHDFNTLTLDTGEKRSLKPLSDEEIWAFADMVLENSDVISFARAIEAKVREEK